MTLVRVDLTTADQNGYRGGILFDVKHHTWEEFEVDQALRPLTYMFVMKRGVYKLAGVDTLLLFPAARVGIFRDLNLDLTQIGDSGQGQSDETGIQLHWTVGIILPTAGSYVDPKNHQISRRPGRLASCNFGVDACRSVVGSTLF